MHLKYRLFCLLLGFNIVTAFATETSVVGGCGTPQFLTHYDKNIVKQINDINNVGRIDITYPPQLKELAFRLKEGINNKSIKQVNLKEEDIKDTPDTRYRHDAVVVVVCFKMK